MTILAFVSIEYFALQELYFDQLHIHQFIIQLINL